MPEIKMHDLKKQIRAARADIKNLSRVYLICGGEGYLKRMALDMLLEICVPSALPEFNFSRISGAGCSLKTIIDSAGQLPMMSDRRCVLAEDFSPQGDLSTLEGCLSGLDGGCTVIFYYLNDMQNNASAKKLLEICKKTGSVLQLETPQRPEIIDIILEEAERNGAKINPGDASFLLDWYGADLSGLVGELKKLSSFAGKKSIDKQMIERICPRSLESNAFHIAGNILRGNADEAFRLTENILSRNDPSQDPVALCSCISGSFVDLYRAKAAISDRISMEQTAADYPADYGGGKAFRIKNAFRDCGSYPAALLARYIGLLFSADLKLKSARGDSRVILEQLIAGLCNARFEI